MVRDVTNERYIDVVSIALNRGGMKHDVLIGVNYRIEYIDFFYNITFNVIVKIPSNFNLLLLYNKILQRL